MPSDEIRLRLGKIQRPPGPRIPAGGPLLLPARHRPPELARRELAGDDLLADAEVRAVLETLWRVAAHNRVLVTYNGKSFDWPMVRDRSTRHHLRHDARGSSKLADQFSRAESGLGRRDPRSQLVHCDLPHHARRRWKRVLPNCKLQRYLCNRSRHNDLSGADVPAAYHKYVRTGAARQVGAIVHHNALDLLTLVQIDLRLLQ